MAEKKDDGLTSTGDQGSGKEPEKKIPDADAIERAKKAMHDELDALLQSFPPAGFPDNENAFAPEFIIGKRLHQFSPGNSLFEIIDEHGHVSAKCIITQDNIYPMHRTSRFSNLRVSGLEGGRVVWYGKGVQPDTTSVTFLIRDDLTGDIFKIVPSSVTGLLK